MKGIYIPGTSDIYTKTKKEDVNYVEFLQVKNPAS
jgi:hypothetical protein